MPRVEVIIRVLNDDRSTLAQSTFQIGEAATRVLTEEVSPMELAQDLGEIFTTSIHEQFPSIGFNTLLGELHVTPSPALPESFREIFQRRLAPFVRRPLTPEIRAAIQREIEAFRAEYPDQMVVPPSVDPNARVDLLEVDFAEMEMRLLDLGNHPDVSMAAAVHDAIEELYQAPEIPQGDSPASRRIRQALRAVVGEGPVDQRPDRIRSVVDLYGVGHVSRRTLLETLGLNESSTRQELEEALSRIPQNPVPDRYTMPAPPDESRRPQINAFREILTEVLGDPGPQPDPLPQDQVRGQRTVGAMLDDAADFGLSPLVPISDRHIADPPTPRQHVALEHFRAIYGGDPRPRTRKGPKPPEDRTTIPTRYRRKPVI